VLLPGPDLELIIIEAAHRAVQMQGSRTYTMPVLPTTASKRLVVPKQDPLALESVNFQSVSVKLKENLVLLQNSNYFWIH
jgi:hypothetical protein